MENKIEIFQSNDNLIELKVQFDTDTVWLTQEQMATLFNKGRSTVAEHIQNIFKEEELIEDLVCRKFRHTTQHGAVKGKTQKKEVKTYNLDVIISVGYRVKSKQGTQFRQWATQRLKDFLVQGYAINEERLNQKQQEVEFLKAGIRIINRAIEQKIDQSGSNMLKLFSKGLELLDDYDHETLDSKGKTEKETVYPNFEAYMLLIKSMYNEYESGVFAQPKDNSFKSSINQIRQSFARIDLYPSIEEKAANLLYFIVKNHSFVDGNKRIAAACFLYFLQQNNSLIKSNGEQIISNEALASLTLFIATSKTEEADIVKRLIISILNRNK